MSVFGLFRTEEELQSIVLQNAHLMMRDRGYGLRETTAGKGECVEARVYGRQQQQVLVVMEKKDVEEKKEYETRCEELFTLFSTERHYRYCVYIHRRPSLTLKQIYTLFQTIKNQMPDTWQLPAFQRFSRSFFYSSVPRHMLQPHFHVLSNTQFAKIRGCTEEVAAQEKWKQARMKWSDPIRRYYNYSHGTLLLVVRDGECTLQSVRFRIVIKDNTPLS